MSADRPPLHVPLSNRSELTIWTNGSASIGDPLNEAFLSATEVDALRVALNRDHEGGDR